MSSAESGNTMEDEESENYLFKPIGIAFGMGILVVNVLLILTVAINKKLHTTTGMLIANLAVANMLAGMMFIFLYAGGFEFDVQHKTVIILTLTASACSLLAIAVDRHIEVTSLTVQQPLGTNSSKRVRRCVFSIILSWLIAVGLSIPPVLGWTCLHDELCSGNYNGLSRNYVLYIRLVIALEYCILVATYVVYVLIYRRMRASTKLVTQQMGNSSLDFHTHRQARLQSTLTLVLGFFTVCWLPFLTFSFVDGVLDDPFDVIIPTIALLNSVANPLIYALRSKEVRSIYLYILCCCKQKPSQCCIPRSASFGKARGVTDAQANPCR